MSVCLEKRRQGVCAATVSCFCALIYCLPCVAFADWKAFIPTPVDNGAFVESFSSFEREYGAGSGDTDWTDTFFRERLTLESSGYSYHPRFMQYQLSMSGLAKHEDFEQSSSDSSGWNNGGGFEYNTTLSFLPEHPYNLILFGSRYEPAFKQQASTSHDTVADTYGVTARYRKKPYFLSTSYVDTSINSDVSSSHVQRLGVDGQIFKHFKNGNELSLNGVFNPSWSTGSNGFEGDAQAMSLGNYIGIGPASLDSTVSKNTFNQQQLYQAKYDTDLRSWYERLAVRWPYSFRSDLSYRLYDNKNTIENRAQEPDQTFSEDGQHIQFDLSHKLYRSLDSNYTLLHEKRDSSGGDLTLLSHFLNLVYTKRIPFGRLSTGTTFGVTDTDNKGFLDIANEPYSTTFPSPAEFTLRQQNIDPATIIVFLHSPLPPFDFVHLIRDVNYIVEESSPNMFLIRIIALPPQFVPVGTYDFFVSYSLESGDFKLETDSVGATASMGLFDELVTPYFSYFAVRSHVEKGTFPGEPVDSDTYTAGLVIRNGPWRARGEYQNVNWQANPYWSWRTQIQYVGRLTPTLNLYASTWYLKRSYEGTNDPNEPGNQTGFDENTLTGAGSLQQQLFLRNVFLSIGGSYSQIWSQVDTQAWSANSSLVWKIGKLEVTFGLNAYGSENTGSNVYSTNLDHELIFLNLKRYLL